MKIYCYNYKKFYVSFTVTTKQKSTVYAQKINEKKTQNIPLQEIINSKLKNGVSKTGRKKQRNYKIARKPFIYLFIFKIFIFTLFYNTVLVLPYIDMNPPWVYMQSQT